MSMFPEIKFDINSIVHVDKGQKIVVGYAYSDGVIVYILSSKSVYKESDLFYAEYPDLKLINKPKNKFVTKYNMGDKVDPTEYIGGILRSSSGEKALYFLTNTEFEPETIQWVEIE